MVITETGIMNKFIVPAGWHAVKLKQFNNDVIDWLQEKGMEVGMDYFVSIVDEVEDTEWPFPGKLRCFYVMFRNSQEALLFGINWSEFVIYE